MDQIVRIADDRHIRRQIVPLTGVRGIACVWVLLYHANLILVDSRMMTPLPILERGYLGVDLFFVLSGFVLAMTYGGSFARIQRTAIHNFYAGRAFRILPLHWLILAAFACLAPLITGDWLIRSEHSLVNWLASFFLVQTLINRGQTWNTPAWSLSAEWLAYTVFPLLAFFVWKMRRTKNLFLLVIISMLILAVISLARHGNLDYEDTSLFGLVRCFTEFFSGMVIYKIGNINPDSKKYGSACLTAGAVILAISLALPKIDLFAPVSFGLIVFSCWSQAEATEVVFGNTVVAWLGKISFSLYLVHWFMIEGTFALLPEGRQNGSVAVVAVVMALGLAVPVAALLYRVIEEPSHRLGRAYLTRRRTSIIAS